MTFLAAAGAIFGGATLLIIYDVYRKTWSESHGFFSALKHYLSIKALSLLGRYMRYKLEKDTIKCVETQNNMLLELIKKNQDTIYGKDFQFRSMKSREDFVSRHPLTTYPHYKPYVDMYAEGMEKVLNADKPIILALTSGTSGSSSMLPMINQQRKLFFTYGVCILYNLMIKTFPGLDQLQRDLKLFYAPKYRKPIAGIPVGPNSSSPQNSKGIWHMYTTPSPAYDIKSEPEATYIYLLYALKDRNVGYIEANFASLVYHAFQKLETHWQQLVNDIERGCINTDIEIPDHVRQKLNETLRPDPKRASELRNEFENGFKGIAKRIWPNLHLVIGVSTGSFELYGEILKKIYCQDVPLFTALYGATEGLIGLNIDPATTEYLLIPKIMFFEFIPIENTDKDQPKTLFVDQVEEGQVYELVITNLSAVYRYRFGDVVKVTGFHNSCPKVEFLYRKGQYLNIRGEKISEKTFYIALQKASKDWCGIQIVDYSCSDTATIQLATGISGWSKPHYVLFIEVADSKILDDELKSKVDESLCVESPIYQSFRQKGSLGPIEVRQVTPGSFSGLKQLLVNRTDVSVNQFKVPRVLQNKPDAVEYMWARLQSVKRLEAQ